MMRQRMVRLEHAELGIRPAGQLAAEHEGDDARQVGLMRQQLQVEQQARVLLERRRDACRPRHQRQLPRVLRLGVLDASFGVADGVEILPDLDAVARSDFPFEAAGGLEHRIEDALFPPPESGPGLRVRRPAVAEQPLEHPARVVLHGQRLRGRAPGDGVRVRARRRLLHAVDGELQRRQLRVAPELLRHELIDGDAGLQPAPGLAHPCPAAVLHAGEKPGGGAVMVLARRPVQAGYHEHAIPKGRQRLQDGRELERRSLRGRRPGRHRYPVRHVHGREALHGFRGRLRQCRQGGHHRVQERQAERDAHPPQHGAPGQRLLDDDHEPAPSRPWAWRIRNGVLRTIPRTMDDQR